MDGIIDDSVYIRVEVEWWKIAAELDVVHCHSFSSFSSSSSSFDTYSYIEEDDALLFDFKRTDTHVHIKWGRFIIIIYFFSKSSTNTTSETNESEKRFLSWINNMNIFLRGCDKKRTTTDYILLYTGGLRFERVGYKTWK